MYSTYQYVTLKLIHFPISIHVKLTYLIILIILIPRVYPL